MPHGIGPIILIFFFFGLGTIVLPVPACTTSKLVQYGNTLNMMCVLCDGKMGAWRGSNTLRGPNPQHHFRQDFRVGIGILIVLIAVQIAEYGMFFAPRQTGTNH